MASFALPPLSHLSPHNRHLFTLFSRGPSIPTPHQTIHSAFHSTAAANPAHPALRHHDGRTQTYSTLDNRSNSLANHLIEAHGIRRGDRICLVYSRGPEMSASILGVLKAGAQYVPLDGSVVSDSSLSHIFLDTDTRVVLCLEKHREKVERNLPAGKRGEISVIVIDDAYDSSDESKRNGDCNKIWHGDISRPYVGSQPEDGAYVIYTSGTTGKPKGVDVKHEGVTNTLLSEPSKLGITVGKNVAQVLSVSFDMGAWEVLATLMNGGTLHTRGSDWEDCLKRVDTIIATPSVLGRFRQVDFPNIKTVAVGGEPCPLPLAEEWAPYADFWNVCGPTEISILNTGHLHKPGEKLTIGKPNPNTNVYILGEDENAVPIGEPGLMWAGGKGVSRGYINLPEVTAARYKYDKFTDDGRMMFNTGDLGRWLEDGNLEHLGRRDDQVKIKGFRVELDGVSAAMERFPTITRACALFIGDTLWGFYESPSPVNESDLKASVGIELPYYAVPSKWHHQVCLFLTSNGKVDKRLLKQIVGGPQYLTPQDSPTTTPTLSPARSRATLIAPGIEGPRSSKKASTTTVTTMATTTTATPAKADSNAEKGTIVLTEEKTSSDSDDSSSDLEATKYNFPEKHGFHGGRWLRHRFFSLYRRFFSIIFITNAVVFFVLLDKAWTNKTYLPVPHLATAVAANLMVAVLMRQDHVVNILYWLVTRLPISAPMCLRRQFARIYHIGGVHSGCAISATMWWIVFTATATTSFLDQSPDNIYPINGPTLGLTYSILALLLVIVSMALPSIREKYHNSFEWTHRFAGWTSLTLVWTHLVAATDSTNIHGANLGTLIVQSPAFYLLIIITFSIILPWLSLRRVKVTPEPLSNHAVRLHFDFTTPPPGKGLRIANHPLTEWHAFATISSPEIHGFSIIVSNAGDWTRSTIDNPPTSVWVKGVPASGVLAMAPLFRKMVLVATGSGIGPCLPLILEGKIPVRVLWSTPNPEETFGKEIIEAVRRADPDAVIWNTRTKGKPDLAKLAYQMYRESGCECVAVISNKRLTQQLVYRMETRDVPAFGPVFDS